MNKPTVPGTDVLLAIENLHVRRGAVEVLKGIDLEVRSGEIVSLIGANGAGKSTLLMAVSGLLNCTGGTIRFQGRPIQKQPPEQRVAGGITQVPEGRRIFPRLTVLENLLVGGSLRRDRHPMQQDLDRVMELFPVLDRRRSQLGGTLSGGEQQMLALGRGLMARPRLLMLDEPSLGLAPKAVAALFEAIEKIHEAGVTILLVEQNAFQALRVSQRAAVLETGRVALRGTPKEMENDPRVRGAYLGG